MDTKQCEACGNDYDKTFDVIFDGNIHIFDSFECAINALAPTCGHCNNRIIGHGVEAGDTMYCCAHCAKEQGNHSLIDRSERGAA